jgi:hypothetical protein
VEHGRTDDLELPLEILGYRSLPIKQFAQLTRHREPAAVAVLGLARIEPHLAGTEIHLAPLERQHLAIDSPTGDVG